jgi:hypothetical protein
MILAIRSKPLQIVFAASALLFVALASSATPPPRALAPLDAGSFRSAAPASACPTFHWEAVPGATGYEIALYALSDEATTEKAPAPRPASHASEPVLRVILPATAAAWAPPAAWCFAAGKTYAWSVRAEGPGADTAWSEPAFFRVDEAATPSRVAKAVASLRDLLGDEEARGVLRELLAEADALAEAEPAAKGAAAPGPIASRPEPEASPAAGGPALAPKGNAGGPVALGTYFLGTDTDQDFELRVNGGAALVLQSTGGTPNLLAGYSGNSIGTGVVGAVIAGGGSSASFSQNTISDDYGTVSGGLGNVAGNGTLLTNDKPYATVGGGLGNQATGAGSTVGGGEYDYAQGNESTVAGGASGVASGTFATVGGGANNHATAARSTIPGGKDAVAAVAGQLAYSSGGFEPAAGDAQWSLYVPRAATTDATPTDLLLDGIDPLTVEDGRTLAFQIHVAARSDAGQAAGYEVTGLIENVGGTSALVGTPTVTVLGEDDASWDVSVAADDANDALEITATGAAATNIRWVAAVRSAEVKF